MNLIKQISLDLNCEYFEDEFRNFHTPGGTLKSQRVYCKFKDNGNQINIVGNYQFGGNIELVKEEPVYSIILSCTGDIEKVNFFYRNSFSKFWYKLFHNSLVYKQINIRYLISKNHITKKLLNNEQFIDFMIKHKVYISSKIIGNQKIITLSVLETVLEIKQLKNVLETMLIISKTISQNPVLPL